MRILIAAITVLLLQACRHPLAIDGAGDISEQLAGVRGCSLEEFQAGSSRCTNNSVTDEAYDVRYEATPRDGWRFLGWRGLTSCAPTSAFPLCEFNISAENVRLSNERNTNLEVPATEAVFLLHATRELRVDANVTGSFGPLLGGDTFDSDVKQMLPAVVLRAGERVTLTASGEVNLAPPGSNPIIAPPDGLAFTAAQRPAGGLFYFPLEEAAVDAGSLTLPIMADVENAGALFGAFVPQRDVYASRFTAVNNDPNPRPVFGIDVGRGFDPDEDFRPGAIGADRLFLVGGGPFEFEASEDGTLFLGVNDSTANNAGAFTVSIVIE